MLALGRLLFPELWQVILDLEAFELAVSPDVHRRLYGIRAVQAGDGDLQIRTACNRRPAYAKRFMQSSEMCAREALLPLPLPKALFLSPAVLTQRSAICGEKRSIWQNMHPARACQYIKTTAVRFSIH